MKSFNRKNAAIVLICILCFTLGATLVRTNVTLAQEVIGERCDKVFDGRMKNGQTWDKRINGTLISTQNYSQLIIYDWCDLTWHDKRVIERSLNLTGYDKGVTLPQ